MKTSAWIVPFACAGWCAGASASVMSDEAVLFHSGAVPEDGTVVELVADDELAQMRGKYLGNVIVNGFMIEMASRWRNEAGQAAAEARLLASNLHGGPATTVSTDVRTSVQMGIHALDGSAPNASVSGGNGVQVGGVGQVTQVAGSNNVASNTSLISMQTAPLPTLPSNGPSASASAQNGFTAQAQIGQGGVQIAVSSPMGVASQSVTPGLAGAAGSVMQVAQLAGNTQVVVNQLTIQLQLQAMSRQQVVQAGVAQALRSIAGLRR